MTSTTRFLLTTFTLLLAVLLPTAQADEATELPGLKVGEIIPDFSLKNAAGETLKSESLLKADQTLAVVFFRSADWCPFCKKHLNALNARLSDLQAAGINVVGISYDSVETLNQFTTNKSIDFPLLSDSNSKVIDGFKVRNEKATKGRAAGIPHPVVILVDSNGQVTGKLGYEGYRKRPAADEIIRTVQGKK